MSRIAERSFLDTNILVYAFDPKAKSKREYAQLRVARAVATGDAAISFQVVQEFLSLALRKFSRPMTQPEAQAYLSQVLMPLCEVFPNASLYSSALSIADETGWTFYDSLIVSAALAADCGVLLTEDLQHGRTIRGMEIRNPFL
jgi:predicted nucleic acid-binding protein